MSSGGKDMEIVILKFSVPLEELEFMLTLIKQIILFDKNLRIFNFAFPVFYKLSDVVVLNIRNFFYKTIHLYS